uniref:Protein kinase domain-containing protein n=1 Tax=Paramoeba aestuarina TaxID=180227 RepID=A0A7S4NUH4_9EUKA
MKVVIPGEFEEVYKGSWKNKEVAMKRTKIGTLREGIVFRIEQEAISHLGLKHENIVTFYGFILSPEPVLIMQWVPTDLSSYLKRNFLIPWPLRWKIYKQIAKGMRYLHDSGVVHHDLRASNVLLGPTGAPRCQLCGFGFGKWKTQTRLKNPTSKIQQEPHWLAPEYGLEGESFGFECDVFSYGVVMYEVSTEGEVPFPNKPSSTTVLEMYKNGEIIAAFGRCKKPDPVFEKLAKRCCSVKPSNRPTFKQILDDIEQITKNLEACCWSLVFSFSSFFFLLPLFFLFLVLFNGVPSVAWSPHPVFTTRIHQVFEILGDRGFESSNRR